MSSNRLNHIVPAVFAVLCACVAADAPPAGAAAAAISTFKVD